MGNYDGNSALCQRITHFLITQCVADWADILIVEYTVTTAGPRAVSAVIALQSAPDGLITINQDVVEQGLDHFLFHTWVSPVREKFRRDVTINAGESVFFDRDIANAILELGAFDGSLPWDV